MKQDDYKTEWQLLQNQFDSYEKHSLYIKLVAILVLLGLLINNAFSLWAIVLMGVLWFQDAIWKTFQSRIESRILLLEEAICGQSNNQSELSAFQFNTQFKEDRSGLAGLLTEYLVQAMRPTVAFPHIALMGLALLAWIF